MKRARYFITARGRSLEAAALDSSSLRSRLIDRTMSRKPQQLSLDFSNPVDDETRSLITGEL